MEIGRFYQKQRDYIAAINRFKVVITQYQTTRHVEEALMRLTETYMALGIVNEAQTAAAVLGHNFPDSPWYKDAYRLVKGGGVEPRRRSGLLDQQGVQEGRAGLAPGHSARAARRRNPDQDRLRTRCFKIARFVLMDSGFAVPRTPDCTECSACSPASRSATSF